MKSQTGKNLTYEEIGNRLNISPQQVHKIEKDAFNKMIKKYMSVADKDIFHSILDISLYLGVDPSQAYKKLDKSNYQKMGEYIHENYNTEIDGFSAKQDDIFLSCFK